MTSIVKSKNFNATSNSPASFNPIKILVRANANYRMRQNMLSLSDEALDDLGLHREQIEKDARSSWN